MRRQLLIGLLLFGSTGLVAQETIRVAVAANFKATLEQLTKPFERETGHRVTLSSASTGALFSQISHGAPFDLFFAADTRSTQKLAQTVSATPFCYAVGRLALVGSAGGINDLADASRSLAIANPATAPYGVAAAQVLQRPEFADAQQRTLLRGNSVLQAYQFWHSGGADLALVALANAPEGILVPSSWHEPLEQHALLLPRGRNRPAVDAYLNWIRSDRVRALISQAGYEPCP